MLKFSVVRDSQQNEFSKGLTNFQHNEEFVDMTIAVDGHMIKVHQNVVALSSPYLRQILKSVPCRHPVLFLNDMKHDIFCFILEYIYLGTVIISQEKMDEFIAVAQNLQISGLTNVVPEDVTYSQNNANPEMTVPEYLPNYSKQLSNYSTNNVKKPRNILTDYSNKNITTTEFLTANSNIPHNINHDTESSQFLFTGDQTDINFPDTYMSNIDSNRQYPKFDIQLTKKNIDIMKKEAQLDVQPMPSYNNLDQPQVHYNITFDVNGQSTMTLVNDNKTPTKVEQNTTCSQDSHRPEDKSLKYRASIPKYSISNRGNLQLILNRYVYSVHHSNKTGDKRRWRCVDYRSSACQAYIDTEGDTLVARKNRHKHSFHDEIIEAKAQKQKFFTTLNHALTASKEEEQIKLRAQEKLETLTKEIIPN